MSLSLEEVRKIAGLARIKLTPQEEQRHATTISAVLEYMEMLNEVDTSGVEPTAQVTGLHDVVRDDVIQACPNGQELVKQFSDRDGDELRVPAVFE